MHLNQDPSVNVANIDSMSSCHHYLLGLRGIHEKTQDALTYVRNYRRLNIFVTFTCNPERKEIKQEYFPGQRLSVLFKNEKYSQKMRSIGHL